MEKKKTINRKRIIWSVVVALLFGLIFGTIQLTQNLFVTTVRNGEEYCDSLYDGQVFKQEFLLEHTDKLAIALLTPAGGATPEQGIAYSLNLGGDVQSGFVPLTELPKEQWTSIRIRANILYQGPATLTLEAVGMNAEKTIQFLIPTNTLQENPELTLKKDGTIIPNGRLQYSYKSWDFAAFFSMTVLVFCIALVLLLLQKQILQGLRKYPLAFLVAGMFAVTLIAKFPELKNINLHVSAQYFLSWFDLGFVRRALAGTVIDLLNIDFTTNVYIIYGISCIAIMLALEMFILYDKRHLKQQRTMQKCFLLFLCMPFTVPAFWGSDFFARFDQVLIIFFLLSCILIIKDRGLWLVPSLSLVAILVHEMYLALFIPFVFCLLFYKWYLTRSCKYMNCLVVTSISSVAVGGYVSFFAKAAIPFEEAWTKIQANGTTEMIWDFPLRVEYYTSMEEIRAMNFGDILRYNLVGNACVTFVVFLPIILLVCAWLYRFWKTQPDQLGKLVVLIFPCTLGGLLISMPIMCDWGRLFIMFGIGVFFTFLTLWSMDARVGDTVLTIHLKVTEKCGEWVLPVLCLFYLLVSNLARGAVTTAPVSFFHVFFN